MNEHSSALYPRDAEVNGTGAQVTSTSGGGSGLLCLLVAVLAAPARLCWAASECADVLGVVSLSQVLHTNALIRDAEDEDLNRLKDHVRQTR